MSPMKIKGVLEQCRAVSQCFDLESIQKALNAACKLFPPHWDAFRN